MSEEAVFRAAVDLTDPAARREFLDDACGSDADLRKRIDVRLAALAAARAGVTVTGPGSPATVEYHAMAEAGTVIAGRYRLLERVGEGGMGEVWVAKQTEPVQRKVALKLIKAGMDSKSVLARFDNERQALAMMDHPSIAKVLDGGLTAEGRPFFVMELVNGQPLTAFCDEAKLTPRERLELFVPVCHAVQHAHQKGIVHRDLKPTNILVTLYDGKPVPKVIDFGVAKATGGRLTEETLSTQFGAVVGTFEYMAPEQAGFSALDVDTRADVYSLGVILYELLTGLRPFEGSRLRKAAIDELFRILREEEPPRPSTKLSTDVSLPTAAAARRTDPKKLAALMRGELDWIVMRCLEKDRNRRYETASGLARDVERYLRDEPVEARPPSAGYRARKFIRRNRGRVMAAGVVLLALVAGVVGTTVGLIEARAQRDAARRAEQQADAERRQADDERRDADTERVRAVTEFRRAEKEEARARAAEGEQRKALAQAEAARVRSEGLRLASEASIIRPSDPGLSVLLGLESVRRYPHHLTFTALYSAAAELHEKRAIPVGAAEVKGVHLSRDGTRALAFTSAWTEQTASVIDLATGNRLASWQGHGQAVSGLDLSPDGKRAVVTATGQTTVVFTDGQKPERATFTNRVAYVWDTATGRDVVHLRRHDDAVVTARFSPDGRKIVTASTDATARIWDAATGRELHVLRGHRNALLTALFSPDGKYVLTVSSQTEKWSGYRDRSGTALADRESIIDPGVMNRPSRNQGSSSGGGSLGGAGREDQPFARLWDAETGQQVGGLDRKDGGSPFGFNQRRPLAAAFSPDGKSIAVGFDGEFAGVWDAAGGEERVVLEGLRGRISAVEYSPDGSELATAGDQGSVAVWDPATGRAARRFEHGTGTVLGVQFSPDGRRLVSFGSDRTARVWHLGTGKELAAFRGHSGPVARAQFLPDGQTVVTAGDNTVRIWSMSPSAPIATLLYEPDPPSGRLATLLGSGPARHTGSVTALAFAPDGKSIYTGSADRTIRRWDVATGRQTAEVATDLRGEVRSLLAGPGGTLYAGTDLTHLFNLDRGGDPQTRLSLVYRWDPTAGKVTRFLKNQNAAISYMELSADGRRLLLRRRPAELQNRPRGATPEHLEVNYNSSHAGEATVWDVDTGDLLCTLPPAQNYEDRPVPHFSPDGATVLYPTERWNDLALYDARTGKLLRTLAMPKDMGFGRWDVAAFSPDGRVIAGQRSRERDLWFWDPATGSHLGVFRPTADVGTWTNFQHVAFAPNSRRVAFTYDRVVFVVDVGTRTLIQTLRGHEDIVTALAFSPDGTRLLTGSQDKTAALWDVESGRLLTVCRGHPQAVTLVVFSPDGSQVATAGPGEPMARVWPADIVPIFEKRKPRDLTPGERLRYELPLAPPK